MTGEDKFRETGEKLKQETEKQKEQRAIALAHAKTQLAGRRTVQVEGLEGMERSEIPLPLYFIIQPTATGLVLSNGEDPDKHIGEIFKNDTGEVVTELDFWLLRQKNITREFRNNRGELEAKVTKKLLGIECGDYKPFHFRLTISSFQAFGQLAKQILDRKLTKAWEFPVHMAIIKREETKEVDGKMTDVKYYSATMKLSETATSPEDMVTLESARLDLYATLDRAGDEEAPPPKPVRVPTYDVPPQPEEGVVADDNKMPF